MSEQNVKLKMNPIVQIMAAIIILFNFLPITVSFKTVQIASTIEKAESIPSKKRVKNKSKFQKLEPGISEAAVGKAI